MTAARKLAALGSQWGTESCQFRFRGGLLWELAALGSQWGTESCQFRFRGGLAP